MIDQRIAPTTMPQASAKCPTSPWHMKVVWTYNNKTKNTVSKTQPCT